MEFKQIPLIAQAKEQLRWLGQRQEVLAQNVANADTPGFRARDLKPLRFGEIIAAAPNPVRMNITRAGHIESPRRADGPFQVSEQRKPYETSPDGNAVVLEEQMAKVSETALSYSLANELYRKQLGMFRIALGHK
jgi:flagellar basal-body rod protein FlgB